MVAKTNRSNRSWFPGYWVAAVSTLALVCTAPGQTMLVSLLNVPFRAEFGLDPLELNASYTVATIVASLPLVWVGRLIDRYGPRRMLIAIALAFGAACAFIATVVHPAMVVVGFFLLRFLGQGSLALVSSHALAMWFHRRLGTVSGLRSAALFLFWAPWPSATAGLINRFGWRATWLCFGVVVAIAVSLASYFGVRDSPESVGWMVDGEPEENAVVASATTPIAAMTLATSGMTLAEARATRSYWLLAGTAMLPPMIGTAILFDLHPIFAAGGLPAAAATESVGLWSVTMAVAALPIGRLVDAFHARWFITAGCVALAAACVLLADVSSIGAARSAMVLYALGQSAVAATVGATTARYFGRRHHGAIRSSVSRMGVIATGLGPLAFGVSQRFTGGFTWALMAFVAISVPVAAFASTLKAPSRGRRAS